jgi:hypothetical protein
MAKSAALRAATLLGRRDEEPDEDDDSPGIFAMSVRLPSPVACKISVMADRAKCSRNEMVNMIVEAGLDAILAATSEDVLFEIHESVEFQIDNFIS